MPGKFSKSSDRSYVTGTLNLARSYLDSANHLTAEKQAGRIKLIFNAPIMALHAHALELLLKACIVYLGASQDEAQKYRHNLLKLYKHLGNTTRGKTWKEELERLNKDHWRSLILTARQAYENRMINAWGFDPDGQLDKFSEDQISQHLPELERQIDWMNKRHAYGGSVFRYHRNRIDSHLALQVFGLEEHIPLRSIRWASEDLSKILASELFPKRKRPGQC